MHTDLTVVVIAFDPIVLGTCFHVSVDIHTGELHCTTSMEGMPASEVNAGAGIMGAVASSFGGGSANKAGAQGPQGPHQKVEMVMTLKSVCGGCPSTAKCNPKAAGFSPTKAGP